MSEDESISGDVLTKARQQRGDVEMLLGERGGIEFRTPQVPIDFYVKRGFISIGEYRTGNRVFRDFKLSGQTPGMIANLDPAKGGGEHHFTEEQMDARDRWRNAMDAVTGTISRLLLLNVCCYCYFLNDVNHLGIGINKRMLKLREALGQLADHYQR